jgi:hypothetical protein
MGEGRAERIGLERAGCGSGEGCVWVKEGLF